MARDNEQVDAGEVDNTAPTPEGDESVGGDEPELEALGEPGTEGVPQPSATESGESAQPPSDDHPQRDGS